LVVEFLKVLGRNPTFQVKTVASLLDRIASDECGSDLKPKDVAFAVAFDVPFARDLPCVFFIFDRIENWLFGQ
jgi:hypothetical protein